MTPSLIVIAGGNGTGAVPGQSAADGDAVVSFMREQLLTMQVAVDEAAMRAELLCAFAENRDARPVILWKPGERWRNDTGIVSFPEQSRIYLEAP